MSNEKTYFQRRDFRSLKSGDSVLAKTFTFTGHPAGTLEKVELTTDYEQFKLSSGEGITISDAVNWVFRIDPQIINWKPNNYNYEISVTSSLGVKRTYLYGIWPIVE